MSSGPILLQPHLLQVDPTALQFRDEGVHQHGLVTGSSRSNHTTSLLEEKRNNHFPGGNSAPNRDVGCVGIMVNGDTGILCHHKSDSSA